MSKVSVKNISRSRGPISCDLADGSEFTLLWGRTKILDESLLTPYMYAREKAGDFLIRKLSNPVTATKKSKNLKED